MTLSSGSRRTVLDTLPLLDPSLDLGGAGAEAEEDDEEEDEEEVKSQGPPLHLLSRKDRSVSISKLIIRILLSCFSMEKYSENLNFAGKKQGWMLAKVMNIIISSPTRNH